MPQVFHNKQIEFIVNSTKRFNVAHGSVRSGKTECVVFRFLEAVDSCPDSKIYIVGYNNDTVERNVIELIFNSPRFATFKPLCTWYRGKGVLTVKDKKITVLGAHDSRAVGKFQGDTYSLAYCDEITLYPDAIIEMIRSRFSQEHSMLFCSCNPSHPNHTVKKWIDMAKEGNPRYYALHFSIEDNPFLPPDYIQSIKETPSGLFYKRNYLGIWCMAEGAIFDFFDRNIHVTDKEPRSADYWIAGIDHGTNNPTACVIIAVSTGFHTQSAPKMQVVDEYYWDPSVKHRQKTPDELADDIAKMFEQYSIKNTYVDPSAAALKLCLGRRGIHCTDANNEVLEGIQTMINAVNNGDCIIQSNCKNLIREIEGYVWDSSAAKKGEDKPLKHADHATDCLRYCIATHKMPKYNPYTKNPGPNQDYLSSRFSPGRRGF